MDIKLIASDLDGTLLDSRKRFSPDLPALLAELRKRGIRFVPASGRQYYNVLKQFGDASMTYIAENGAMIVENGKCLLLDEIPHGMVVQAIELARQLPHAFALLSGEQGAWMEDDDPVFKRNAEMYCVRLKKVPDLTQVTDRICKIAVFEAGNAEHGCLPVFQKLDAQVVLSGTDWIDMMNYGVSKGSAIQRLCDIFGISLDECMAFGDYLNDLEMLQTAVHSFAMANAHPDLLKVCKHRAPSNDEDGVVRTIRNYLRIPRIVSA